MTSALFIADAQILSTCLSQERSGVKVMPKYSYSSTQPMVSLYRVMSQSTGGSLLRAWNHISFDFVVLAFHLQRVECLSTAETTFLMSETDWHGIAASSAKRRARTTAEPVAPASRHRFP